MSLRDEIGDLVSEALSPDKTFDELADQILALLTPTLEKARKWDRLMSITEPLAITPLAEDWHDTWSTTCPCLPLVIGNVIVHIGGGCSFGGKEDGDA